VKRHPGGAGAAPAPDDRDGGKPQVGPGLDWRGLASQWRISCRSRFRHEPWSDGVNALVTAVTPALRSVVGGVVRSPVETRSNSTVELLIGRQTPPSAFSRT
jgi:hypothetical protein